MGNRERTKQAVGAAIEQLRARGVQTWRSPSMIRREMGFGSLSDIIVFRNDWIAEQGEHERHGASALGRDVPPQAQEAAAAATSRLVSEAWRNAREAAAAEVEEARRGAREEAAVARADRDEVVADLERLEGQLAEAMERVAAMGRHADAAHEQHRELAAANGDLRRQLEQALVLIGEQQDSASKARVASEAGASALRDDLMRAAERERDLRAALDAARQSARDANDAAAEWRRQVERAEDAAQSAREAAAALELHLEGARKAVLAGQEAQERQQERIGRLEAESSAEAQRAAEAVATAQNLESKVSALEQVGGALRKQLETIETWGPAIDKRLESIARSVEGLAAVRAVEGEDRQ